MLAEAAALVALGLGTMVVVECVGNVDVVAVANGADGGKLEAGEAHHEIKKRSSKLRLARKAAVRLGSLCDQ